MGRKQMEMGNDDNSKNLDHEGKNKRVIAKRRCEINLVQNFHAGIFYDSPFIYSDLL